MKKRILTLAVVATLAVVMTACGGTEQTNSNPTSTVAPTVEAEATTAPTATSTPTVEPTTEPTATSTPVPATPTELIYVAPDLDEVERIRDSLVVMDESGLFVSYFKEFDPATVYDGTFASLATALNVFSSYEECEAYIETLDKSRYEVIAYDNLDLILSAELTQEQRNSTAETLLYNILTYMQEIECNSPWPDKYLKRTGEYYLMTVKDTTTNEITSFSVKIHCIDWGAPWNEVPVDDTVYVLTRTLRQVNDKLYDIEAFEEVDLNGDELLGDPSWYDME